MQVVGGPNSTGEGMNKNKYWREVERELCLAVLALSLIHIFQMNASLILI